MQIPTPLHPFNVSLSEAVQIQKKLVQLIDTTPLQRPIRYILGLDAAFSPDMQTCIAGGVVYDLETRHVVETAVATHPVLIPYIPGFLSFREAPALLAVIQKIQHEPDVLMCDGHGLAHPRRLGIATHIGILCARPSLGCGKSRLCGYYHEPDLNRGSESPLTFKGECVGIVLRTKDNVRPVFVSAGNKMDLKTAKECVLATFNGYRLPEPTRLADRLVAEAKISLFSK